MWRKQPIQLFVLVLMALCGSNVGAQNGTSYTFNNPPPDRVTSGSAIVVGDTGTTAWSYWIVAKYAGGDAQAYGPLTVTTGRPLAQMGTFRYNSLTWTAQPLATGYDVLRTATTTPPTGACACVISSAQVATTLQDTGLSTGAYTVTTGTGKYAAIYMDTLNSATPKLKQDLNGTVSDIGSGSISADGTSILNASNVFSANSAVVQYRATAQAGASTYCRSTTGNDTYTCALTPTLTAYTTGMCLALNPDTANTGAASLNIDALGAKNILTRSLSTPANGDVPANINTTLCYDGTQFVPAVGGGTTVAKNGLYLTIGSTDYIPDSMYAATKPPQTGWSWVGTAGTEAFGSDGSMVLTGSASAKTIRTRTITTETIAIVAFRCNLTTGTANYSACGVFLRESSTGKGPMYQQNLYGSVSAPYGINISYQNWVADAYSGQLFASPWNGATQYVKVDWSTTDVILSTSPDGTNWTVSNTTAKASLFTTAPNQLSFVNDSQTPANKMVILSLSLT